MEYTGAADSGCSLPPCGGGVGRGVVVVARDNSIRTDPHPQPGRGAARVLCTGVLQRDRTVTAMTTSAPAADVHARLAGVTRVFPAAAGQREVHALGPVDLALMRGEFFAVVGP